MFNPLRLIRNQIRKAEAAAALENLLKIQVDIGNLQGNPHKIANTMIAETWARSGKHVNWQIVEPPHKVSLVAISLSERLEKLEYGDDTFFAYGLSLGTVLLTASRNRLALAFSPLDEYLLSAATETYEKICKVLENLPITKEIGAVINNSLK